MKPRKNQRGVYRSPIEKRNVPFTVIGTDSDNITTATYHYPWGDRVGTFICQFAEGPNVYHDWPGKEMAVH